ncbi:hypothetical protein [Mycoplasma todarodis]|uniref:Uncharacterized protein n=1 Tax=Mycoplasma todarodis TaxID=1937191 RepID=A0A4R0XW19_9MOLU|nr:hypothetical protein [Mycoplasma todarodis]TCG12085.1 hypothetical protein C4B25_00120 [Mycoplasma todarodis]
MKIEESIKTKKRAIKLNKKIGLHIISLPTIFLLVWCVVVIVPFFTYFFLKKPEITQPWIYSIFALIGTTLIHISQILWLCFKYLFIYKRIIKELGDKPSYIEIILRNMGWPSLKFNDKELKMWMKKPLIRLWPYIPPIGFLWFLILAAFAFITGGDGTFFSSSKLSDLKKRIEQEILDYETSNKNAD